MKYIIPALRFKIFMTVLLGLIYPFAMTGLSQILFPKQASGEFISRGGQVIGSVKIAQSFESAGYLWTRPSAVAYNHLPSGGSNYGQISHALKITGNARRTKIKQAHPDQSIEPPQDLLYASGSGLDPHISPESAYYQIGRVALARKMNSENVRTLVEQIIEQRQLGFLGEPTVNVLELNLALDKSQGIDAAPVLAPVVPPAPASSDSSIPAAAAPSDKK